MEKYLECTRAKCGWAGKESDLVGVRVSPVETSMVCPDCGNDTHYVLKIMDACVEAQKEAIANRLDGKSYNTKEKMLAYFDHVPFYGHAVVQSQYKRLTVVLNRLASKGLLIKLDKGAGSYSKYTFPKEDLEKMIDEVIESRS